MLTLAISGFDVLQLLLALGSGGLSGLVQFGCVSTIAALAIFYYLTRPHVAAAFGQRVRRSDMPGDASERSGTRE